MEICNYTCHLASSLKRYTEHWNSTTAHGWHDTITDFCPLVTKFEKQYGKQFMSTKWDECIFYS